MAVSRQTIWFLGVAAAAVAAAALFVYFGNIPMQHPAIKQVMIGTTTVVVEVADTEILREQGLSGRDSLEPGHGMLFVFDRPQVAGFWMKDMRFSLDMLFIDASSTIVTISRNVLPESYHENPPQVFSSYKPVLYVIEVPAGFASEHNIGIGDKVVLQ